MLESEPCAPYLQTRLDLWSSRAQSRVTGENGLCSPLAERWKDCRSTTRLQDDKVPAWGKLDKNPSFSKLDANPRTNAETDEHCQNILSQTAFFKCTTRLHVQGKLGRGASKNVSDGFSEGFSVVYARSTFSRSSLPGVWHGDRAKQRQRCVVNKIKIERAGQTKEEWRPPLLLW